MLHPNGANGARAVRHAEKPSSRWGKHSTVVVVVDVNAAVVL